jgi:ribosomal protein L37AE/L43A
MKQRGNRYCPICSTKLQRRGLTASGVQRWYCKTCSSSHTKPRHDVLRSNQLTGFISHLLSTESQTTMSKTRQYADRTWRTNTAWCWNIVPKPKRTGEACPVLLIDGTIVALLTGGGLPTKPVLRGIRCYVQSQSRLSSSAMARKA